VPKSSWSHDEDLKVLTNGIRWTAGRK